MALSFVSVKKPSPRLIDYVVFVGKRHPSRHGQPVSQPELLRVYPPQNHDDFALPSDVIFFCQPEGCYNTSSTSFVTDPRHSEGRSPQNIKMECFTFMLTDKESNTARFGVCLNFLRPIGRRKSNYIAEVTRRRIASFKSKLQQPILKIENNRIRSCDNLSDSSSSDDSLQGGCHHLDRPERPYTHTLTSICLVSRYQFCKKFQRCLQFLYTLIQKLHEGCKPRYSGRQTVWSVLTGAIESAEIPAVRKSVEEIDTWILRLLSIPAPVFGRTAIHAYLQPPDLAKPIIFALPDKHRFSLVDYPLHLPLSLLGIEKFIKVFFSLLLEQKIVLESSHHERLTTCVMSFTALCYPLQYLFTVIPLLPSSLKGAEQLLQAPSPYIIGIPRNFRDSRPSLQLPKDVLLVDLDTQELYGQGAQDPVPKLPAAVEKQLVSHLNKALAGLRGLRDETSGVGVSRKDKITSKSHSLNLELNSPDFLFPDLDEDSLNVAIRVAMVRFFKSPYLLGGFTDHTRTVRLYPRPVVAFQYERFMKSRPDPAPFTIVLARTQAVEYFAEWSLMPDNLVYQKIGDDVFRPSEIGDKDQWFSDDLMIVPFQLWTERFDRGLLRPVVELLSSTPHQGCWSASKQLKVNDSSSATTFSASVSCEIGISSDSETPTDVGGSTDDDQANSDEKTFSDVESGDDDSMKHQASPLHKEDLFSSLALSTSEVVEYMQVGKELPPSLRPYYSPPASLVIPGTESPSSSAKLSSAYLDSSFSSRLLKRTTQSSASTPSHLHASTPTPTSDGGETRALNFNSPERQHDFDPGTSVKKASVAKLSVSSSESTSQAPPPSQPRTSMSTLGTIFDSWFVDGRRTSDDANDLAGRKQRAEMEVSENERFISGCVSGVQKGNQPGVFSRRRLQRLMEDESYRNMALAVANKNVGNPVPEGQHHISDVFLTSWDQFKAYVWLFIQIGVGVRQSFCPMTSTFVDSRGDIISPVGLAHALRELFTSQSEKERLLRGGICSAFGLLEMAHTHCHLLPKRRTQTLQANRKTQPPVSLSVPNSPKVRSGEISGNVSSEEDSWNMSLAPLPESDASCRGSEQDNESIAESEAAFNVIDPQNPDASPLLTNASSSSSFNQMQNEDEGTHDPASSGGFSENTLEDLMLLPPYKSAESLGYRFRHGHLFQMAANVAPTVGTPPPSCVSVPALRKSLAAQRRTSRAELISTPTTDQAYTRTPSPHTPEGENEINHDHQRPKIGQTYLFEEAMINATSSKLWTNMQFWEDLFLDTVAQERCLLGMDFDPIEFFEHYSQLSPIDKKRLELDEDALLAGVMHNLIAFMVMARIPPDRIRLKIRRLLAKSHIGLHYTQKITQLLDCLEWLRGNDIDLLPIASRQFLPETFSVILVAEGDSEALIMEIYSDFLLIRSLNGDTVCRWWFDQIINVTHSPQTNVVCFQTRVDKTRERFIFTASNTRLLFTSIASAMGRVRSKVVQGQIIQKLGGRVDVVDVETGDRGQIHLGPNGFQLLFGDKSKLIPLDQVKKCKVANEDTFSFVVAGHGDSDVVWNFKTDLATILLNQWERLISVALVKKPLTIMSGAATPTSQSRAPSFSNLGAYDRQTRIPT
uniref:MAP kinase-activating death domain protein n=1 Tax=Mesocestoides corti TaxID=53468 RepID=A0A5K3ENR5_MESCO